MIHLIFWFIQVLLCLSVADTEVFMTHRGQEDLQYEWLTTHKHSKCILFEGHVFYNKNTNKSGIATYLCRAAFNSFESNKERQCTMKLKFDTKTQTIVAVEASHNPNHAETYDASWYQHNADLQSIKEKMDKMQITAKEAYNEHCRDNIDTATNGIASYSQVRCGLWKHRSIKLPRSASDLSINDTYYKYNIYGRPNSSHPEKRQQFHFQPNQDPRIHIFCSYSQCAIASGKSLFMTDGTFDITPSIANRELPWTQVFTLYAGIETEKENVQIFLVLLALLPNKETISYQIVLAWWLQYMNGFGFKVGIVKNEKGWLLLLLDFEGGQRNGLAVEFDNADIDAEERGEFFHKTQALMKNLQKHHLKELYTFYDKDNADFYNQFNYAIKMLFSLDFLPETVVQTVFEFLVPVIEKSLACIPFRKKSVKSTKKESSRHLKCYLQDYYVKTWLNGKYCIAESNFFKQSVRVTVALEARNGAMQKETGTHPNTFEFMDSVAEWENQAVISYMQVMKHGSTHQRNKELEAREIKLWEVWNQCDKKMEETPLDQIPVQWWFQKLVDITNIMYPAKK